MITIPDHEATTAINDAMRAAPAPRPTTKACTFVLFSADLDKLLMAFTLANAAAASGMPVTLFFTFWSVAALRKPAKTKGKTLIDRMFGWMMPAGSKSLGLSRMNFGGMGAPMIRWRMRKKQVASLEEHIAMAPQLGVRFVICETSMDLLGFRREEMPATAEYAGAAACLAAATSSTVSMVI